MFEAMFRRTLPMALGFLCAISAGAQNTRPTGEISEAPPPGQLRKLPTGVILLKGAMPSSSDSSTPLPESGDVTRDVYRNAYFGLSYTLPAGWFEKYKGPPPSDSGGYLLTLLRPGPAYKGASKATLLITAQDLFFTPLPVSNARETIAYTKETLQADYKVERQPAEVTIANHSFARLDYTSPVAGLHWYVLATEIRCHAIRFVFTSRDPAYLETLIKDMSAMKLPADADPVSGTGGVDSPLCVPHYAEGANVTYRVDPAMTERKFNAVPVRVIIDKAGRVRHVHVISGFPEQSKAITEALVQWRFKPYVHEGQPVEVETGILFGAPPRPARPASTASSRATKSSGD
ncbi:MAG TPA: energy transducer TonB [Thermoanaerobaculia bacterium]|nr:energy transducer TonB [Thermoanaerobaculia bacterium]